MPRLQTELGPLLRAIDDLVRSQEESDHEGFTLVSDEAVTALLKASRILRVRGDSLSLPRTLSFDAYERACLEAALKAANDHRPTAAGLLGIGRSTLYRLLARHGFPTRATQPGKAR